jgi:urate oxidase
MCSPEEYVVALGRQFVDSYPLISAVEVRLEEKPWTRTHVMGKPHDHGYSMQGPCTRTAQVSGEWGRWNVSSYVSYSKLSYICRV